MNNPAGWYLQNPNDTTIHYWDGSRFTGDQMDKGTYNVPVFTQEPTPPASPFNPRPTFPAPTQQAQPFQPQDTQPFVQNEAGPGQQPYAGQPAYNPAYNQATPAKSPAKKIIIIVASILVGLLIIIGALVAIGAKALHDTAPVRNNGGSVFPTQVPTTTPTTPETIPSPSQSSGALSKQDTTYLNNLHKLEPTTFGTVPDSQLISTGKQVCSTLDSGASIKDVATTLLNSGLEARASGELVGTAVPVYCPSHQGELDAFIKMYTK